MAAPDDLYDARIQIYLALDAILEHQSDETISTALTTIGAWEAQYHNGLAECWNIMQPYVNNYNPQFIAAYQAWVAGALAQIYGAINPIIFDGNANNQHYDVAVINQQSQEILDAMAEMNVFRNPLNMDQYQAPFTDHQ